MRTTHIVRNGRQLAALVSAPRQEIVDVLAEMGTVSVAELAATLGRPADALYFHLRALVKAGLVRQLAHRASNGRQEALFRTVADELRLHYQPRRADNRTAVSALVRSMLRLGMRDFERAMRRRDVAVSGTHRELWALRQTGRLTPTRVAEVNRAIEQLRHSATRTRGEGRLYAITVLLTPIDRRRRTGAARNKKAGKR